MKVTEKILDVSRAAPFPWCPFCDQNKQMDAPYPMVKNKNAMRVGTIRYTVNEN